MSDAKPSGRVLPDEPAYQPLERFWPYADLSEQPDDDELAKLHPELRDVIFGAPSLPFSISLAFPAFEGEAYVRALALAKAADEYIEVTEQGVLRHRARYFPARRPLALHELYDVVAGVPGLDILIDDRPVPYARELWLPLVWCLIR